MDEIHVIIFFVFLCSGRAGATGTAITFFDPEGDKSHAKELVRLVFLHDNQLIIRSS